MSMCSENVIIFLEEFNESKEQYKNSLTWTNPWSVQPNISSPIVAMSRCQGKCKKRVEMESTGCSVLLGSKLHFNYICN